MAFSKLLLLQNNMFIDIHTHLPKHLSTSCINTSPIDVHHHTLFSCGLHPWHLHNASTDIISLQQIIQQPACIAIGECGLDKLCLTDWQTQEYFFTTQVQLANIVQKPLIIHCVKACTEVITILQQTKNKMPVIIHGFNQRKHVLAQWQSIDAYISIGKALLNPNSNAQQVLHTIPINKLFLETDNAPVDIAMIYKAAAEILNIPINELAQQLSTNYNTIFAQQS
jgi:TatD DNase family protein